MRGSLKSEEFTCYKQPQWCLIMKTVKLKLYLIYTVRRYKQSTPESCGGIKYSLFLYQFKYGFYPSTAQAQQVRGKWISSVIQQEVMADVGKRDASLHRGSQIGRKFTDFQNILSHQ